MVKDRKLLSVEMGRVSSGEYKELPQIGLVVVLDNIRSAHNVGSAFRTCDSFKIDKLWLCGICAVPPSAEIHKSALGAEDSVPWEHSDSTVDASDMTLEIPQFGTKHSLNVSVSVGVVLWHFTLARLMDKSLLQPRRPEHHGH